MHESALSRAALPAPTVCLGMLLHPYSLGHELWLIRESNATLRGSIDGLPGAVLICSQTWDELKAMRSDHLLGLKLKLWNWRTRRAKLNLADELTKFLEYRTEGLLEFPISQVARADRGNARMPGTPFILRLQQWLMLTLRLTEAQAWDYPVGLSKLRWAAHWEQEGGLDVYNAHEAEADEHVAYWESQGGPGAMKKAAAEAAKEAKCPA